MSKCILRVFSNLDYYMERDNLTAKELSQKIGVSEAEIEDICFNTYVPDVYTALMLSVYFDVSVNDLFYIGKQEI